MTIRETLVQWQKDRIAALKEAKAPESIIAREQEALIDGPCVQGLEFYGNKEVESFKELDTDDSGLDPIILFQCKQIFPVLMFTEHKQEDRSDCQLCKDRKPHGHAPIGVTKLVHLHWLV